MSRYLITGIAGFIGSALARRLVAEGHDVRGVDNLSTGKTDNLEDIAGSIEFIVGDILDQEAMNKACRDVDFVLHQAALPSVVWSIDDPMTTHRVNTDGTLTMLLAARDAKVRRVVYASSCAVYGDAELPNHEGARPRPLSPYAVSKISGEFYLDSFYRVYNLETVSLRYFNVFGPRQDAGSEYAGVIGKFITMMTRGEAPTIFGDGEQSRDFTFVDNIVEANLRACCAPTAAGGVFNIGMGSSISVNQVYRTLQTLTGFAGDPIHAPERPGEIKHSCADILSAAERLGYAPPVAFEDGMRTTVRWFGELIRRSDLPRAESGARSR